MNEIRLKGRLTADPEIRYTQGDTPKAVASFTVAVNRRFKRETADFIECQAWGKTADLLEKYFKKGQEILLGGELQSTQYEDREGNKKKSWRVEVDWVEFCGSLGQANVSNNVSDVPDSSNNVPKDTSFVPDDADLDDEDMPF